MMADHVLGAVLQRLSVADSVVSLSTDAPRGQRLGQLLHALGDKT